jgi:hypothetical protein
MSSPGPGVKTHALGGLLLSSLVSLATAATILVNFLATGLPINGQTTGDVTRRFEVFFIPAGYAFSIWSVIYVGLFAYSVYLSLAIARKRGADTALDIAPWYVVTAAANCCWLLAWHYNQFPLSMLLMVVLLVSLIVIYRMLAVRPASSRLEWWAVHIPFRVYLGWISVATIANATITLDDAGWNGFGLAEPTWGLIMVVAATVLGLTMSALFADVAYVAVLVWALVAVAVRLNETTSIFVAALVGAVALVLSLVVTVARRRGAQSVVQT